MPLIRKEDTRDEQALRVRLRPEIATQLAAYAQFAESSEGHIVNAALERLFAADKEFKEFLTRNPDAGKPETAKPVPVKQPRKRKAEANDQSTDQTSSAA